MMMKGLLHNSLCKYIYFRTQQRKPLSSLLVLLVSLFTNASQLGANYVLASLRIGLRRLSSVASFMKPSVYSQTWVKPSNVSICAIFRDFGNTISFSRE